MFSCARAVMSEKNSWIFSKRRWICSPRYFTVRDTRGRGMKTSSVSVTEMLKRIGSVIASANIAWKL